MCHTLTANGRACSPDFNRPAQPPGLASLAQKTAMKKDVGRMARHVFSLDMLVRAVPAQDSAEAVRNFKIPMFFG